MNISNLFHLYVGLNLVLCTTCDLEFSNEWLAEIHATPEEVKEIVNRYGFVYISSLYVICKVDKKTYILRHSASPLRSRSRAEGIRKSIMEEKQVKTMEQQKWNKRVLRSVNINDPYWPQMWYLNGNKRPDMGVLNAWSLGYTGKGVTIGIVDDGVDTNHPDLTPNLDTQLSYDFYSRDNDPLPDQGNPHGTECAGVATAASNNSICVVGVAFHAKLAGLRLLGALGSTDTGEHDALSRKGVDIFSNSWGIGERNQFDGPSQLVKKSLYQGIQTGRNGLGSIYVWAAGNGGTDDNCNCDGFVNSIYTIAISSVSYTLQPPGYAEPCSAIMATVYSGGGGSSNNVCTTSQNNACVKSFTGTSASTPMAAGMIALVLQANPRLTWRDLQHLIVNTSVTTGLQYGKVMSNGAGHNVSDYFGFGLLQSDLLIERALEWESVPKQHICTFKSGNVNKRIFNRSPARNISSQIKSDGCNGSVDEIERLEHVEIDINYKYTFRGSVQFYLDSPSGTRSQLLSRRDRDLQTNNQQTWTFMSVQFWDESPVGNWTLLISLDMDYGEAGELLEWSLKLFGTSTKYENTNEETGTTSTPDDVTPSAPGHITSLTPGDTTVFSGDVTTSTSGTGTVVSSTPGIVSTQGYVTFSRVSVTAFETTTNGQNDDDCKVSCMKTYIIIGVIILIVTLVLLCLIFVHVKYKITKQKKIDVININLHPITNEAQLKSH